MKAADIGITRYIKESTQDFENGLASFLMALLNRLVTINLQTLISMLPIVDSDLYLNDFALVFVVPNDRLNKLVVSL